MSDYIPRNYRIKFRMCLRKDVSKNSANYNKYYMPKWGDFIKAIMSIRLSSYNNSKTASFKELPKLRKIVNKNLKTEIIAPFLSTYNPNLTRMLLEVAPFFDSSPTDLKCHILAVFGVTADSLESYLESKDD